MTLAKIGTVIAVVGYALSIYGGWLLYKNAAPEHGHGTVPVLSGSKVREYFANQEVQVKKRRLGNDVGFALLTGGSALQMVGTAISGFAV